MLSKGYFLLLTSAILSTIGARPLDQAPCGAVTVTVTIGSNGSVLPAMTTVSPVPEVNTVPPAGASTAPSAPAASSPPAVAPSAPQATAPSSPQGAAPSSQPPVAPSVPAGSGGLPALPSTIPSGSRPSAPAGGTNPSNVPVGTPVESDIPAPTQVGSGPANPSATAPGLPPVNQFWMETVKRQGQPGYGAAGWKVFRNVKDYGAKGDGTTDDTDAINSAVSDGGRCGQGCDSQTTTPALVYFPAGTYIVSAPIIQLYYTQFIGDALHLPVLKASPGFKGMAIIDSDPYDNKGNNWYTNQNNFYRQVRNFVIDLTAMPASAGAGIHWQVAQATSLQNIVFEMVRGGDNNKQIGIFMDNGSGGFMTDLVFNGGQYGAFLGSQQFTTRNMTFNGCQTAIFMNWNWLWTLKSINVNSCGTAVDMSNGGTNQTVGSVLLVDSNIKDTPIGVATGFGNAPATGGTLILDNVNFDNCPAAVTVDKKTVLQGNTKIASWAQGKQYGAAVAGQKVQKTLQARTKPAALLDSNGKIFERARPQYEAWPASLFISAKDNGAKGDGRTDDTAAVQAVINKAAQTQNGIAYFDHGAYVVSDTIKVPKNVRIVGEMWPLIMASGKGFSDEKNPKPVFQVGAAGDEGLVEISDLVFETLGAAPGAILVEWNIRDPAGMPGVAGMWDVHFRVGGSAGTGLQSDKCSKNPKSKNPVNRECMGAFLMLHITKTASGYFENNWLWVSDHELDLKDHNQIDIFNGRGMLVEAQQGPVWLYGSASEHSQLYNYQFTNSKNVFMGHIQTETPYYQSNPTAAVPFVENSVFSDPSFGNCTTGNCNKAWGLRIENSENILMYGGGLYSFFDNYAQDCLATESCQDNMISFEGNGNKNIMLYGLSTKASTNMVNYPGGTVPQIDNRSNFCSTVALFSV